MTDVRRSWDNLVAELRHIRERGAVDASYFMTIRSLFEKIPELLLYDDFLDTGINLVHYTTWKNALDMLNPDHEDPVLRMYNYEQSNDPDEGQIRPPEWEEVEREANWLDEFLKDDSRWAEDMKFGGSTYGCSFSSGPSDVEDDLTYWRLYGNDGQGCSLKISPTHGARVYKVRYQDKNFGTRSKCQKKEDEQVAERLKMLFEAGKETVDCTPDSHRNIVGKTVAEGLRRVIYAYYHLIKHIAYEEEQEWRMIAVMPKPDQIRYDTASENLVKRYVEGPAFRQLLSSASAVTIGPAVLNRGAARAYFGHLTMGHGMDYVLVKNSNKTYRQTSSPKPV